MRNKSGFTMIELLVVLIIVAILVAIAAPLYLANVKRSRMSEAIATLGLIRQAERDYKVNHNAYFDIAEVTARAVGNGNIRNGFPTAMDNVATGDPNPDTAGVDINVGAVQYFSNGVFSVDANTASASITSIRGVATALFTNPTPVDFIVSAKGNNSASCPGAALGASESCAARATEIQDTAITDGADYEAVMDNSGRIFVCYGAVGALCTAAANWTAY